MTKKELLQDERIFGAANGDVSYIPLHSLDKFLSKNVVTPKGENRHPYADVLHEWLEDTTKQIEGSYKDSNFWRPIDGFLSKEYRIKPVSVYEWLWYDAKGNVLWLTDAEAVGSNMFKAEETKRERK